MSDGYAEELLIDGVLFRRSHDPGEVLYHSLNGSLPVMRATYRRVGQRNGPTAVPLDLDAGLVERGTPALGYSIALNLGKETSREDVANALTQQRLNTFANSLLEQLRAEAQIVEK